MWGLDWNSIPQSSYTIAIDSIPKMLDKLAEQSGWPIYKIKLGTDHDLEIVKALRLATSAQLRVDANCAWTVQQAIEMSEALADLGVEFIEQPLPAGAPAADHRRLYLESRLPIIADESCCHEQDVAACHRLFHGINIKLCKCGGLTPAKRMLTQARQLGMKTMVGCMIESSIGISSAAQLLPLLDFADLDGACLLAADPAQGVILDKGTVRLSDRVGHGGRLQPRKNSFP
jgi:L-alanine-DL-glutamate epimerase-like enolase superfamily enzyme